MLSDFFNLLIAFSGEYFWFMIIAWIGLVTIAILAQMIIGGCVKLDNPVTWILGILLGIVSAISDFLSKVAGGLVVIMMITILINGII